VAGAGVAAGAGVGAGVGVGCKEGIRKSVHPWTSKQY
jgi:hypothetical protein